MKLQIAHSPSIRSIQVLLNPHLNQQCTLALGIHFNTLNMDSNSQPSPNVTYRTRNASTRRASQFVQSQPLALGKCFAYQILDIY